jgi:TonB family protein
MERLASGRNEFSRRSNTPGWTFCLTGRRFPGVSCTLSCTSTPPSRRIIFGSPMFACLRTSRRPTSLTWAALSVCLLTAGLVLPARPAAAQDQGTAPTAEATLPEERFPILIGGMKALQKELRYPKKARKKGIEGRVAVRFIVSTEGVPIEVHVPDPVHPLLDAEAVRAISTRRFVPGVKDGELVAVQLTILLTFSK